MTRVRPTALAAALALLLAPSVTGCVGLGYLSTAHRSGLSPDSHRPFHDATHPIRPHELEERLGKPDERRVAENGDESWVYDRGLRWNGPVLFVVVPVPLIVPVGRNRDTYHIRDYEVVGVDRVATSRWYAICGMTGAHTGGCDSFTSLSP